MNRTRIRRLPLPLRAAIEIVAPTGEHRARPAVVLPDEPVPPRTTPIVHGLLSEGELEEQLEHGAVLANEFDMCPDEQKTTFHALYRDGLRKCWTCGCVTAGGV